MLLRSVINSEETLPAEQRPTLKDYAEEKKQQEL